MDKKVFEAYSQYYDLLYNDKDYSKETEYVNSLIKQFRPLTKNILELGCGSGIHAKKLAELDYYVEGIDLSETMLRLAINRQSESERAVSQRLSFLEGDIRSYESALRFDTIISLFHVMSYMITNEDLHKTFITVKKHLKPQGIFIFDCWHGPGVLKDKPTTRTKFFENEVVSINRKSRPTLIPKENRVDVDFDILIQNKATHHEIKLHELHSMRYLFIDEIISIAKINGLEIIQAEEWISKKTLTEDSWNACYVCRNKN